MQRLITNIPTTSHRSRRKFGERFTPYLVKRRFRVRISLHAWQHTLLNAARHVGRDTDSARLLRHLARVG